MTKIAEYIGTFVETVMLEDPKASVTVRAIEYGACIAVRRYSETRKYGADQILSTADVDAQVASIPIRAREHARRACADIARLIAFDNEDAANRTLEGK